MIIEALQLFGIFVLSGIMLSLPPLYLMAFVYFTSDND